jgi:hypothetical protein
LSVAKSILHQLFEKRTGNVPLMEILSSAYDQCTMTTSDDEYENTVWDTLERALKATLPGSRELIMVVDGMDESVCGEKSLLKRLEKATTHGVNVKLITLGTEKPSSAFTQSNVQITDSLIFDDIMAVVRSCFHGCKAFASMSELE